MKVQNTNNKTQYIKCPHCQASYLPGELYMPGALIGQPDEIVKDCFGKIIYHDYYSANRTPDMIEHYTCDVCGKAFVVEATVTYKTYTEEPEKDFSTPYVSLI